MGQKGVMGVRWGRNLAEIAPKTGRFDPKKALETPHLG